MIATATRVATRSSARRESTRLSTCSIRNYQGPHIQALSPTCTYAMSGDDDSSGWQLTESDPGVFRCVFLVRMIACRRRSYRRALYV